MASSPSLARYHDTLVGNQGKLSNKTKPCSVGKGLIARALNNLAIHQMGPYLPTEIFTAMLYIETLQPYRNSVEAQLGNCGPNSP